MLNSPTSLKEEFWCQEGKIRTNGETRKLELCNRSDSEEFNITWTLVNYTLDTLLEFDTERNSLLNLSLFIL